MSISCPYCGWTKRFTTENRRELLGIIDKTSNRKALYRQLVSEAKKNTPAYADSFEGRMEKLDYEMVTGTSELIRKTSRNKNEKIPASKAVGCDGMILYIMKNASIKKTIKECKYEY